MFIRMIAVVIHPRYVLNVVYDAWTARVWCEIVEPAEHRLHRRAPLFSLFVAIIIT